MIDGIMFPSGVCPSDVANFLNQMETLVTLTGLEVILNMASGKLVYTCTIYVQVVVAYIVL